MTQRSLHWDGSTVGDANLLTENVADGIGYRLGNENYESPLVDRMFRMLWNGDEDRGVLKGWLNELAVTGAATPVSVNTGGAVVYGMPYENTSSVNVAVTSPTTDTRQDLIVLRRNWSAQTIRITKIDGIEGGSVPSATQSPAPTGTGIYDIPLASISVTTGGAITVTDLREYCQFGTGIADDAFGTTHLTNDSIELLDRATTTKRLFLGGGDLQPMLNAGRMSYLSFAGSHVMSGSPVWDGAANEEAWQHTGLNYRGLNYTFQTPADYAGGSLFFYFWWVNNAVVAATFYIRGVLQRWSPYPLSYSTSSEYITASGAVGDVFRTDGPVRAVMLGNEFWNCWVGIYNTAGVEDISIMGVEVVYTGYV